jgi:Uri superfamily endonuclease
VKRKVTATRSDPQPRDRGGRPQGMTRMPDPSSYQLVIAVARPVRCAVGRLGVFEFPAGRYVYTGSAKRNFEARIARHLRQEKALRWHIDFLLAAPGVHVIRVVRSRRDECVLHRAGRGRVIVPGFGASDCHEGCGAHLKYLGTAEHAGPPNGRTPA